LNLPRVVEGKRDHDRNREEEVDEEEQRVHREGMPLYERHTAPEDTAARGPRFDRDEVIRIQSTAPCRPAARRGTMITIRAMRTNDIDAAAG
jgi:hypothetical protein